MASWTKTVLVSAGAAVALSMSGGAASALEYPTKNVELYVGFKPGGTTDSTARVLARMLEKKTGVKAIVVNQAAGGGVVATQTVKDAKPDGSKLLVFHGMIHVAYELGRSPYSANDLTPLATVSVNADVYAARKDAPFNTLPELFDYAKSHEVTLASQMGGTTQVKGDALAKASGGTIRIVAAGGMSKRLTALLGEQVDLATISVGLARQYLDSGDLKPLAVISAKPDPFEPDWPTAKSQGVDISFPQVGEVYGPKGMAPELVKQISAVFAEIAVDPEFADGLSKAKQSPDFRAPEETEAFLKDEWNFVKGLVSK